MWVTEGVGGSLKGCGGHWRVEGVTEGLGVIEGVGVTEGVNWWSLKLRGWVRSCTEGLGGVS